MSEKKEMRTILNDISDFIVKIFNPIEDPEKFGMTTNILCTPQLIIKLGYRWSNIQDIYKRGKKNDTKNAE